ncbi:MAG TPA: DUF1294 domain-containing protein [Erysipelotrichaceae bacterium]|nr:DUF1294 domain-containing protein [Erysipelotrichaceae bacterium]
MLDKNIIKTYLIALNILTFIMFAIDKNRSIHNKYRLSVNFLLTLALAGGSLGALLAMYIFKHKISKFIFKYGILIMMIAQIILYVYIK